MNRRWATAALLAGLGLFAGLPLALLLGRALRSTDVAWWSTWAAPEAVQALAGTLVTSVGAAGLSFLIGVPLAVLLVRTDVGLKRWLRAAFTLPTAIPPFILGMGWVSLANPRAGLLNLALGAGALDIYGPAGVSLVLGSAGLPLVLLSTAAALGRIDSSLDEAARMSGASPLRAVLTVTLPLALPAALSGTALAFLFAASAFGVPYLLGVTATPPTPTLTTRIYSEVLMGPQGLERAAVLSVELLALAAAVMLVSRRLGRAGEVRLSSGKGLSLRPMALGRWRAPLTITAASLAIVLVALPLLAVALTSVQPVWGQLSGLTTRHWGAVLSSPRTLAAAGNSAALALAAATLVTGLGLAIATTRRRWLGALAGAPYAVPGTVLALGLLVAFSRDVRLVAFDRVAFVLALGNTLWMLLVAYTVKHLAFGARNAADALAQVDPSLAEAARVFGASPTRAFVDATLPQLRGALGAAFLVTFLVCMTELTLSVLLLPTGGDVLGTLLFELQSYADPGAAAVIACAFVLLLLAAQGLQAALTRKAAR
jgi:iron(III) transport system permease protein